MLTWITANLVNILLTFAVALVVGLLIFVMVRDKKAGKCACGGNCGSCASCGGCRACSRSCACGKGGAERS